MRNYILKTWIGYVAVTQITFICINGLKILPKYDAVQEQCYLSQYTSQCLSLQSVFSY